MMMIIGGITSTGCTRIAAVAFLMVVRTRSAAMAATNRAAGRLGPCPIRALLRAPFRAARRCAMVSPGSR
jgi:hypothetical protein